MRDEPLRPVGELFIEQSRLISETPMREERPGVWTWDEYRCLGEVCHTVTRCHVDVTSEPGALATLLRSKSQRSGR